MNTHSKVNQARHYIAVIAALYAHLSLGCSADVDEHDGEQIGTVDDFGAEPAASDGANEYETTEDAWDVDGTALAYDPTDATDTEATADAETLGNPSEVGTLQQALLAPSSVVRFFDLTVVTGNDDLRGGNDNAFVTFFFDDGRLVRASINDGFRLADRTSRFLRIPVPGGATFSLLAGFEICGTMRGGLGGDNWNIDRLTVTALSQRASQTVFNRFASPLARLTGDRRCVFFSL